MCFTLLISFRAFRCHGNSATQWETKNDDYGRVFYANWETGEAVYEPPAEMGYRPPLGRNELGEKVDPRLQALRCVGSGKRGKQKKCGTLKLLRNEGAYDQRRLLSS